MVKVLRRRRPMESMERFVHWTVDLNLDRLKGKHDWYPADVPVN